MTTFAPLHVLIDRAARARPAHVAIEEPDSGASITYSEFAALTEHVRVGLARLGVRRGDRVGILVRKSIDAIGAIVGTLKAGAAYVPVDLGAPVWRAGYILGDCGVKVLVGEAALVEPLRAEFTSLGLSPCVVALNGAFGGRALRAALDQVDDPAPERDPAAASVGPDDLAYILYTSGSTGKPKGVMLSHLNAWAFVDWCVRTFAPGSDDRFSSHAPLHFDLSILDLYVPLTQGASLVLIGTETGREPLRLAALISERQLTVWYSAPSILSMLAQYGKLERYDYSHLRTVLFAGEVFPVKYLRLLKRLWPRPRFVNLYGPTETNVCTFHEIPAIVPEDRTDPYPIGRVCDQLRGRLVDDAGADVPPDAEGELVISGLNVMQGYWNLPERNAQAVLVDSGGTRWYRTGDIVVRDAAGDLVFMGRRDRMVKRRGHRIELGDVEAGLYRHPAVREAAVVARPDEESGVRIKAFLTCRGDTRPSLIELKRFCADTLPASLIPDEFSLLHTLPKTSTDKIDYQRLGEM